MADPVGVSIAFAAAPLVADPAWTRIDTLAGCRVRGWQIDRGRPDEFSKTDVGTAVVRIVDLDGIFDPTNSTSPYDGLILPGKQAAIALQNPVTDVWFTMFRGHIESWTYRLDRTRQYMELELQLVDAFAILSRVELQVGVDGALPPYTGTPEAEKLAELAAGNVLYGETEGPVKDRLDAVAGDAKWPVALRDFFTGNVRVGPKAYPPGTSALAALFDAVDAEWPGVGNLWVSKDGLLTFRGRQARFRPDVAEYGIQKRTVGDPSAWEADEDVVPLSDIEWSIGNENVYNAASATPQGVGTGVGWRPLDPDLDPVENQYVTDAGLGADDPVRSITFDNLQTIEGIATGNDALEETRLFAQFYVDNYSTPALRISRLVFRSRALTAPNAAALWNHMCKCEISDLLTVQTRHPGSTPTYPSGHPTGGGFDDQFYVEGIHMTCRPGGDVPIIELSLDVSPRAHYTTNPFDADTDPIGP